jgi:hypothetical protein
VVVPAQALILNRDGLDVAVADHGVARIRPLLETRDLGAAVEVSAGQRVNGG